MSLVSKVFQFANRQPSLVACRVVVLEFPGGFVTAEYCSASEMHLLNGNWGYVLMFHDSLLPEGMTVDLVRQCDLIGYECFATPTPTPTPTSTEYEATPTPTPTAYEGTPTEYEGTPTALEATPTELEPTPTAFEPTPTALEATPTELEATPTPTAYEPTPTALEATPTPTPSAYEATPSAYLPTPTPTPTAYEGTPTELEATPTAYEPTATPSLYFPTPTPTEYEGTPTAYEPTPTEYPDIDFIWNTGFGQSDTTLNMSWTTSPAISSGLYIARIEWDIFGSGLWGNSATVEATDNSYTATGLSSLTDYEFRAQLETVLGSIIDPYEDHPSNPGSTL